MNLCCSNCGAKKDIRYSAANVVSAVKAGWGSYGSALYCPNCSASWNERNPGRPMAGEENTLTVIDKLHTAQRRRRRYE